MPGYWGVKWVASAITVRWPSNSISVFTSSKPLAIFRFASKFTSLSTCNTFFSLLNPVTASSVRAMFLLADFSASLVTVRMSVPFLLTRVPKVTAEPLKVRLTSFTLDLPVLHEATVSLPISSRLSAFSTLTPQNTQLSVISTLMVGADADGWGVGSGCRASLSPAQPASMTRTIHAMRIILEIFFQYKLLFQVFIRSSSF